METGSGTHQTPKRGGSNKRKCPLCSRTFTKTEHLERHIRSHTKEKPFRCQECGRNYSRNDSLLRHIKDSHSNANDGKLSSIEQENIDSGIFGTGPTSENTTYTDPSLVNNVPIGFPPGTSYGGELNDEDLVIDASTTPQNVGSNQHLSSIGEPSWLMTFQPELVPDQEWPGVADFDFAAQYSNLLPLGNLDGLLYNWPFAPPNETFSAEGVSTVNSNSFKPLADLQHVWHTNLDTTGDLQVPSSGYVTPSASQNQNEIDDHYRQSLHQRLQIHQSDQVLPSSEYLNLCVKSYFKRFHFVLPIVHAPTFKPSKQNSVLLLSICSIGSLLTGHPSAVPRGIQLFERLNKAILTYWEALIRQGREERLATVQAAVIGQTFGLLSGQAKHLALVEAFHGTIISWARRAKIFETQHSPLIVEQLHSRQDIEQAWRTWAKKEEEVRVTLGLRIHDAEIAGIFHHETLLPCVPKKYQAAASDALFLAPGPQEWWSMYKSISKQAASYLVPAGPMSTGSSTTQRDNASGTAEILQQRFESISDNSHFATYSALEDFVSAIIDARMTESLTIDYTEKMQQILVAFHKQHLQTIPTKPFEPLQTCLKILWHFLFIVLHCDLELLEKCTGRDGAELKDSDAADINEWAGSSSSKRSVAHSLMIKRHLESFPLSSEPAMHVPKTIFFSSIVLFCYLRYKPVIGTGTPYNTVLDSNFSEFRYLNIDVVSLLKEANIDVSNTALTPTSSTGSEVIGFLLCAQVDLLKRIGHWEISRKFASILETLIHAESP